MASNIYTAQEMRHAADLREAWGDKDEVNDMLRQAADAMERESKLEKKYEYALKYLAKDGSCYVSRFHNDTLDEAKRCSDTFNGETFVVLRREVGEWEEVKDEN